MHDRDPLGIELDRVFATLPEAVDKSIELRRNHFYLQVEQERSRMLADVAVMLKELEIEP